MSDAPETGTGFLVPVFGTDFWYVGHWHKNARRCKRTRDFALTRQHVSTHSQLTALLLVFTTYNSAMLRLHGHNALTCTASDLFTVFGVT